ncbi:hypothetical protein RB594_003004 [Gaeumannomyces avenae]
MALLSEVDIISSLDDALMIISSGAHHHHHRHAGKSTSSTAKSLSAAAADHGPPLQPGSNTSIHASTMGAVLQPVSSDEWSSRPHRGSSVSSTSSGSLSDGSRSTAASTPDGDASRSAHISRASTIDSLSTPDNCDTTTTTTTPTAVANAAAAAIAQLDPLARDYPAPAATDGLDLDEMLARKPQKWTLGHYFHKSRAAGYNGNGGDASGSSSSPPLDDIAAGHRRKSELERAKKELLAAQEEIRQLAVGRV